MSAPLASLLALLAAIVLACTTRINVGLVAIALAWLIGVGVAGLDPAAVVDGFPTSLFFTLTGVTLLFALADVNGTLEALARRAVSLARGDRRLLPILFFAIALVLAAIGPGAIVAVALVAPLAMAMGARAGVPSFLISLMIANGAGAGNLSPLSAVGVIANTKIAEAGIGAYPWRVCLANFVAQTLVAAAAWVYYASAGRRAVGVVPDRVTVDTAPAPTTPAPRLDRAQIITVAVLLAWIAAVLAVELPIGLGAFVAAAVLILARVADEATAIARVPWGVILMVCGVSVLIGVVEASGGMELFTAMLAAIATPSTIYGAIAFVTGVISTYSSTSGVVLPAFLPTVPGLVEQVGGGDLLGVALAINIGSSLVDVSPLSTGGALCVAAVADRAEARTLYRRLLIWGLSMALVGAAIAQVLAPAIARF
jgi:Na+/H+ antiporter NhaD/arsenite permease-like protein